MHSFSDFYNLRANGKFTVALNHGAWLLCSKNGFTLARARGFQSNPLCSKIGFTLARAGDFQSNPLRSTVTVPGLFTRKINMRPFKPKCLVCLVYICFFWACIRETSARPSPSSKDGSSAGHPRVTMSQASNSHHISPQAPHQRDTLSPAKVNKLQDVFPGKFGPPHISSGNFISASGISYSPTRGECTVTLNIQVNCSARGLSYLPNIDFPTQITTYDLSHNRIAALPSHGFSRYTLLRTLNLEQNLISKIDPLAFVGLSNLEYLLLSENKLVMNNETLRNAFSEKVFAPLNNLTKLRLEGNNPEPNSKKLRYPDRALSYLANLKELYLDGLADAVFGFGFSYLTKLSVLSLQGYWKGRCELTSLRNDTFQYLTPVEDLSLSHCNLQGPQIQAGTFLPLKRLKQLHLDYNQDINVQYFDSIFFGLQNTSSLKSLCMQSVVNPYTIGICLSSQYIKYFPQSVEYLDIKHNRLECIDRQVIDKIKTSLRVLDISRNGFVFGTYLMDLHKLERLRYFRLDDKIISASELPRDYPYNPHTLPLDTGNCSLYARNGGENNNKEFTLKLPPNLINVQMRYTEYLYILSKFQIDTNNSLQILKLEGNYFPYLKGPVTGLNSLRYFRLSFNNVHRISEEFFQTFPSLETLNLSSNYLGDFFTSNPKTKIFRPLVKLQVLDLASNAIRALGRNIFDGMTELRFLRISHNPMYYFDSDLSHKIKLTTFIAIDTSISFLPKGTRDVFSERVKMGLRVQVELDQSPIVCDCQNFPFLQWMVSSGAFHFKSRDYLCYYPDTSSIAIHDGYAGTMDRLSRECASHQSLLLALVAGTVGFVMFTVCSLAYRYRWKLRYMYHAAYIYMARGARPANHFDYDVFVCYAEEDRRFVMDMLSPALEARGLSVCVHHRHFTAGELIGSNIVRAVNTCRRTVVVLTRTLAESSWCNYEIQMANMESAQRGTPVLIFLLVGGIRRCQMEKDLLYNVQNNTYIQFPPESCSNERAVNTLYDKLARDIRE
ncbi:Toll-like receptor 13 [Elysia marginata]|uniref:Toll-like receptor 13 n=1 Tax=Elysia marginata TaxID=1093978 RepID=A0AAV4ESG6_9GAST|nr:Toll-like receptor 13 [Elysia marginata]